MENLMSSNFYIRTTKRERASHLLLDIIQRGLYREENKLGQSGLVVWQENSEFLDQREGGKVSRRSVVINFLDLDWNLTWCCFDTRYCLIFQKLHDFRLEEKFNVGRGRWLGREQTTLWSFSDIFFLLDNIAASMLPSVPLCRDIWWL